MITSPTTSSLWQWKRVIKLTLLFRMVKCSPGLGPSKYGFSIYSFMVILLSWMMVCKSFSVHLNSTMAVSNAVCHKISSFTFDIVKDVKPCKIHKVFDLYIIHRYHIKYISRKCNSKISHVNFQRY